VVVVVVLATSIIIMLVVTAIILAVVTPVVAVIATIVIASVVTAVVAVVITSIPFIIASIGPAITIITSIRSTVTIVEASITVLIIVVAAIGLLGVRRDSRGMLQFLALPHGVLSIAVELALVVPDHVEVTFEEGGWSWWICHVGFTRSLARPVSSVIVVFAVEVKHHRVLSVD
jgi:hypothetical protein